MKKFDLKKFLSTFFGVILVLGIIFSALSFSDASAGMKSHKVNLNESVRSDFESTYAVSGEVYYVYDLIATEEVTRTTYGVKTGTDITNFYLIDTYDKAWFEEPENEFKPMTVIYGTADKEKIAKLDKMVEDWYAYEDAYYEWASDEDAKDEDFPEIPTETFDIENAVITKFNDDKLLRFRDEYLVEIGFMTEDDKSYAERNCPDYIIMDRNPDSAKTAFILGIVMSVIGLAGVIFIFIKGRKKKNEAVEEATEIVLNEENNIIDGAEENTSNDEENLN